jgi:pantoate--beta-alanine ligase
VEVIRRVQSMKEICRQARARGRRVGFVPTMGALHEGHLALMRRTKELCDILIVSVFVNPTQFGPGEDLAEYPRNLTADVDLCIAEKVDYVFAPPQEELYPPNSQTFVDVTEVARQYEGASRPEHFRGVATVVLKLFQIVQPTIATFGQKDAQQAVVVRRMVKDLMLDVEILVLPVVRDEDGLALSSRNRYLSPDERQAALAIPHALAAAQEMVSEGERRPDRILASVRNLLDAEEWVNVDYLEIVDAERFERVDSLEGEMFLIVAADVGKTRLIDNVTLLV